MTATAPSSVAGRPNRGRFGRPAPALPWSRPTTPHLLLAVLLFAVYVLVSVLRYARYGSPSYDLAIFTEAVKAYAHLRAPLVPVKGDAFNVLGDHFSPVTAVLAPVWRVWPGACMLLVAQAALFAWSAGVVSATAEQHLGRARGLCTGIAYGLSFGILRAVDAEFHEIAFAVPLLAVVCRQLLARRPDRALWWSLPLLLVKEDQGLTVAAVGVLVALQSRRRLPGLLLAAGGLAATAVTVLWIVPSFNTVGSYDYWTKLGGRPDWRQLLWEAAGRLQTWKTLGWTAGVTGLLALGSPLALLAVPTLAWRTVSTNPTYWGPDWHYSAVLMPVLFLAVVDTAARAGSSDRPWLRRYADRTVTALPAVALACMASMTYGPGGLARAEAWTAGRAGADRAAALAAIPDGVTVEAMRAVLPRLAARTDAYWYGAAKALPPQYIVFDAYEWKGAPGAADAPRAARRLHPGAAYRVVFARGKVTVVRLA